MRGYRNKGIERCIKDVHASHATQQPIKLQQTQQPLLQRHTDSIFDLSTLMVRGDGGIRSMCDECDVRGIRGVCVMRRDVR